jgi:hypothetical protein
MGPNWKKNSVMRTHMPHWILLVGSCAGTSRGRPCAALNLLVGSGAVWQIPLRQDLCGSFRGRYPPSPSLPRASLTRWRHLLGSVFPLLALFGQSSTQAANRITTRSVEVAFGPIWGCRLKWVLGKITSNLFRFTAQQLFWPKSALLAYRRG